MVKTPSNSDGRSNLTNLEHWAKQSRPCQILDYRSSKNCCRVIRYLISVLFSWQIEITLVDSKVQSLGWPRTFLTILKGKGQNPARKPRKSRSNSVDANSASLLRFGDCKMGWKDRDLCKETILKSEALRVSTTTMSGRQDKVSTFRHTGGQCNLRQNAVSPAGFQGNGCSLP